MNIAQIRFFIFGFVSIICTPILCTLLGQLFNNLYINITFYCFGYYLIPFTCFDNVCVHHFLDDNFKPRRRKKFLWA